MQFEPTRKKRVCIAGLVILLLCIISYISYTVWFSPTRILIINPLPAQAADIILNNDSRHIQITCLPTEEVTNFNGYDAVVLYGRGLYLTDEQMAAIEHSSAKGVRFFTNTFRNFNVIVHRNITDEQQATLLSYFGNPSRQNYRNGIRYLRHIADANKLPKETYEPSIILPTNLYYHQEYGKYFQNKNELTSYLKDNGIYHDNGKNIAFIAGSSFPTEGNRAHVDTLISRITHAGFNVYPLASSNKRAEMLRELHPDAIVYLPMGRLGNDSLINWLHTENIPIFCPFPLIQSTEEWLDPIKPVSGGTLTARVLIPEVDGAMAPLLIATQNLHKSGHYLYTPEEERVNNFVNHLKKHLLLRNKPNNEKRVAICYFKSPGKDALLASGMEVVPSLYNFLKHLQAEGYNLTGLPATVEEFGKRIYTDGVVLGSYAQGAQEEFLRKANPVWLTTAQYETWGKEVIAPEKYKEVIDRYGPAPGELLVRKTDNRESQIAVACLQFGNVLLFPQPRPALGDDDFKLVHGMPVAPPHSYLAPYLYMQKGFGADAIIHFGTHGNLEYTPGKNVALSHNDWADVLVGDLPHFYYYTTGNVGEGIIAKRRTHAVLVTHLTPPYVESGMRQRYQSLLGDIHHILHEGNERNRSLAVRIKQEVMTLGLHRDLELDSVPGTPYTIEELEKLDLFMEEIANEKTLGAFYTMGQPYSPRDLITTTLAISADPLAYDLARHDRDDGKITTEQLQDFGFVSHRYLQQAKKMITEVLTTTSPLRGTPPQKGGEFLRYRNLLLTSTTNELSAMTRALNGGSVFPAPGGDPVLNPNVLPTGRNMFSVNAETTPSARSWDEGTRLAETTLNLYKEKHGDYPRKISYTFWAGEFITTEGATLAQAFRMLGVEPVRDGQNRVVDLRLTPSEELGRPRINIVIQVSGQLRDLAGSRLKMLTDAIQLASSATEDMYPNYVASGTQLQEKLLVEQGISPKRAREMSVMRVFGPVNSGYSTGMLSYTENSGKWDDESELVSGYLNNMGAIYGDDENWGAVEKDLFASALSETDVIIQPRQSNTWGPLSLDHVYEFTGGLSLTVRSLTGKEPDAFMADYRNRNNKRLQNVKEAVAVEARATILNPTFVQERMKGEATTAQMFGEIFRNIFGWHATRPSAMDKELYNDLYRMYIIDENSLGLHEYFDRVNPAAFQAITSVMLESARKGYWKPTEEQLRTTATIHAEATQKNGAACTEFVCDNDKLQQFIAENLSGQQALEYNQQMKVVHDANANNKSMILRQEELNGEPNKEDKIINGIHAIIVVIVLLGFIIWLRFRRGSSRTARK
ncbi:cobaltochelatase subunit CobN [Bacteroides sp. 51]|uniref:cobaltochelatase subunit CobN n=1 Tax=Bacteroides sp. 51 TaxID=2302938 RepID=UPI0013D7880A|nr:cobaltochelatase subunit CobN [Bacteroides sp. 51]NDV82000.1 cobaltochelatase subunit CobN [Bacteroides sp. 51]